MLLAPCSRRATVLMSRGTPVPSRIQRSSLGPPSFFLFFSAVFGGLSDCPPWILAPSWPRQSGISAGTSPERPSAYEWGHRPLLPSM